MRIPITEFVLVLLIFMRIFAAFVASPVIGNKAIPVLTKVFLSLILAYICFLTIDKTHIEVQLSLAWLLTNSIKEIITGVILGFMLNFVFFGIQYAGSLMSFSMELSMAESLNPVDGTSSNLIGEIYYFAAILLLLLINGHYYIISGLVYSFSIIHIGKFSVSKPVYDLILKYTGAVFVIAVKIASPILVSFFLVYLAEGILARVVPQMQVFFVTQPLITGLGIFMLFALTPVYIYVIKSLLHGYENNLASIIKAMGQ